MPKRVPFIHKLLKHIDRIDRNSIEGHFTDLLAELHAYEDVFHQISEGVVLTDQTGRILFINRQAQTWLGVYSEPNGKSRIQDTAQDQEFVRFLESRLPQLKEKVIGNLHLLIPKEMHLNIALAPLQHIEKTVLILLAPVPERELSGNAKLSRVEALISLAAGIAHEIGNPLNSIAIHLQLLKKEVKSLPAAQKKNFDDTLEVLNAETARLDRIVKNFLKATRKPPLRFKSEDLNEIVQAAISFMKPELAANKIRMTFERFPGLPLFLLDRERLYQVCINLIKNSMEAMPKGGNLSLRISRQENIALLTLKDEGCGITDTDLPHIFEAYYTTKEEGSGLGLLTVFNAVKEHGGRIEVASRVGKGTTFTILLPMRQPKLQLPGKVK